MPQQFLLIAQIISCHFNQFFWVKSTVRKKSGKEGPELRFVGGRYLADSADRPCDTWDRDVIHFGNRPVDFLLDVTQTMLVFQYKKYGLLQIVKSFVSPLNSVSFYKDT